MPQLEVKITELGVFVDVEPIVSGVEVPKGGIHLKVRPPVANSAPRVFFVYGLDNEEEPLLGQALLRHSDMPALLSYKLVNQYMLALNNGWPDTEAVIPAVYLASELRAITLKERTDEAKTHSWSTIKLFFGHSPYGAEFYIRRKVFQPLMVS